MTVPEPPPGGGITATELEGETIGNIETVPWRLTIDNMGTDTQKAITYIKGPGSVYAQNWAPPAQIIFTEYENTVIQALEEQLIFPEDLTKATDWVTTQHGISSMSYKFIASGLLLAGLALWGFLNNRPGAKPTVPVVGAPPLAVQGARYGYEPGTIITTSPTRELILAGVPVPLPDTAGGQVVVRAQTPIKPVKITNTGLTTQQAKAISLGIAQGYADHLKVLVNAVDHIENQIAGVERQLADDRVIQRRDVRNLEHQINDLQAKIPTTAVGPPGPQGQPGPVGTPGPAGSPGTTLSPDQLAAIAEVPAIAALTIAPGSELSTTASSALASQTELQTLGAPPPGTTFQQLEDCCAENAAVTNPIRNGGATPSLLGTLGALLSKGFELFLLAASIDAILALFDLPDVILATLYDADVIQGQVEKVTAVMLKDFTWVESLRGKTLVRG